MHTASIKESFHKTEKDDVLLLSAVDCHRYCCCRATRKRCTALSLGVVDNSGVFTVSSSQMLKKRVTRIAVVHVFTLLSDFLKKENAEWC